MRRLGEAIVGLSGYTYVDGDNLEVEFLIQSNELAITEIQLDMVKEGDRGVYLEQMHFRDFDGMVKYIKTFPEVRLPKGYRLKVLTPETYYIQKVRKLIKKQWGVWVEYTQSPLNNRNRENSKDKGGVICDSYIPF